MTHTRIPLRLTPFFTLFLLLIFENLANAADKRSIIQKAKQASPRVTQTSRPLTGGGGDSGFGTKRMTNPSADGSGEFVGAVFGDPAGPAGEALSIVKKAEGPASAARPTKAKGSGGKAGLPKGQYFTRLPAIPAELVKQFAGYRAIQNLGITNRSLFRRYVFELPAKPSKAKKKSRRFVWRSGKEQIRVSRKSRKRRKQLAQKRTTAPMDIKRQREVLTLFSNEHFALDPVLSIKLSSIPHWMNDIERLPKRIVKNHGFSENRRKLLLDFLRKRKVLFDRSLHRDPSFGSKWYLAAASENNAALELLKDFSGASAFKPQVKTMRDVLERVKSRGEISFEEFDRRLLHGEALKASDTLIPFYEAQGTLMQQAKFHGDLEYHGRRQQRFNEDRANRERHRLIFRILKQHKAPYHQLRESEIAYLRSKSVVREEMESQFQERLSRAETTYTKLKEKAKYQAEIAARKSKGEKKDYDLYPQHLKALGAPLEIQAQAAGEALFHRTQDVYGHGLATQGLKEALVAQGALKFMIDNGGSAEQIARAQGVFEGSLLGKSKTMREPYRSGYISDEWKEHYRAYYEGEFSILQKFGTPEQEDRAFAKFSAISRVHTYNKLEEEVVRHTHELFEEGYKRGEISLLSLAEARADVAAYNAKTSSNQPSYYRDPETPILASLARFESMIKTLIENKEPIYALGHAGKRGR